MRRRRFSTIGLLAACAAAAAGQTRIDLRTQAGNVDFTGAASTRPVKSGTSLPATCSPGELFFKTDAPGGRNLYGCAPANTWTAAAGEQELPPAAGHGDQLLWTTGVGAEWKPVAGDLTGFPASVTVTALQGRSVSAAAPLDGHALVWDGATAAWRPQLLARGASMAVQLGDLDVKRTSDTVLTIGQNCSVAAPCNVRSGKTVYRITSSSTAALGGGTGAAYIYADAGAITVGHNLAVTCTGCVARADVTAFPADVVPLFTWTAQNGTWDALGGTDQRAWLSTTRLAAGPGITISEVSGVPTVAVDADTVAQVNSGDGAPPAACPAGTFYFRTDLRQLYACTADDTFEPASYASGTEAERPVACVRGQVYLAHDTGYLHYCAADGNPGTWNVIAGSGSGGAVATVFGRSGNVMAQAGDYNTSMVPENGNLYYTDARARAAVGASGPVAYNAVSGVFSCPTCVTGDTALGGDLSGTPPEATVTRLQGRPVAATAPADGQALVWNDAAAEWQPASGGAGLAGSGAASRIAFWTGDKTLGSSSALTWDGGGLSAPLIASGGALMGYRYIVNRAQATCSAGAVSVPHGGYVRIDLNNEASCAFTVPDGSTGEVKLLQICHGSTTATGAVSWPANVRGGMAAAGSAGTCMTQTFLYDWTNAAWYATGPGLAGL